MGAVSHIKHEGAAAALSGSVRGLAVTESKSTSASKLPYEPLRDSIINTATNTVHSKVLTAGELSDFKKWEQWEGWHLPGKILYRK